MIATQPHFYTPAKEDALWAAPLLAASGNFGCEYSFVTLYMWREMYHTQIAREDGYLFMCSGEGEQRSFLPPVGGSFMGGVERLLDYTAREKIPLRLHSVTEQQLQQLSDCFGGNVRYEERRNSFDYLYRSFDLANLPGKEYHSKKNHISAFSRKYDWSFEPITDQNTAEVIALSKRWCAERGVCREESIRVERCGVRELLQNRELFGVKGGLLRVNEEAVAFTLGSPINEHVFDVHVEKALSAYAGAYAVINREFASQLTQYEYLNREDDMGLEGLRKAKLSYRPVLLLKKFSCEIG